MSIVAFSGHRPNKLGGYKLPNPTYNYIYGQIQNTLEILKPSKVISGMALGIDQWAAMIAIRMSIPVTAAVPFEGQQSNWPTDSQKLYNKLISLASDKIIVCEGTYSAHKMQLRNEWMVNNCDTLVAVYNGDVNGGTANCVKYAQSLTKNIVYIDPTY